MRRESWVGAALTFVVTSGACAGGAGKDQESAARDTAGVVQVTSTRQALTIDNGLAFNGLGANGIALNGIALNGIALNGIVLNGIALNGIALNGIALNGIALNGIALNGIALNGIALNGIALNGIALNGIALNGIALNGIALNGIALNGTTSGNFKLVLRFVTECALPTGQCLDATDLDGTPLRYCGAVGIDPAWATGVPTPSKAAAMGQCVLDRSRAAGYSAVFTPVNLTNFKKILMYMAQCALPEGHSITLSDENSLPWTLSGSFGLAPEWETGPMNPEGGRYVSACLAARTNAKGQTVRLSVRGVPLAAAGATEQAAYSWAEGAFWGDLFAAQPFITTCQGQGPGISGRTCAAGANCGFTYAGPCASASVCQSRDAAEAYFTDCGGHAEVLTTFLPLGTGASYGATHSCIHNAEGKVWCWGSDGFGELGDTLDQSFSISPVVPIGMRDVVEVASGSLHSCARTRGGSVYCWGSDGSGQLGIGSGSAAYAPPTTVNDLGSDVARIAAASFSSCAIRSDGTLWCWGYMGDFGLDTPAFSTIRPVQLVTLGDAVADVMMGLMASCALTSDGRLWCWGPLFNASPTTPALVLESVTDFCVGSNHICARRPDGTIWCRGDNSANQLGIVSDPPRSSGSFLQVENLPVTPARALVCMHSSTCARDATGAVRCWGNNGLGQLGNESIISTSAYPVRVVGLSGRAVGLVGSGDAGHHACAKFADGSLYCWGSNYYGQLGDGTTLAVSGATKVTIVPTTSSTCGNSSCETYETTADCPGDCGSRCGDWVCNGAETATTCPADCGPYCGDWICNGTETAAACPDDCGCGNGVVDPGEKCDGGRCCTLKCTLRTAGTICRYSVGGCDVAETCSGNDASCPSDGFLSSGTVCRASEGVCDVPEFCSGSSAYCSPTKILAPAGTVCRPSAGPCDAAETCSGASVDCPADSFAAAGNPCRPAAGTCDVAEMCTGSSAACPADTLAPISAMCPADGGVDTSISPPEAVPDAGVAEPIADAGAAPTAKPAFADAGRDAGPVGSEEMNVPSADPIADGPAPTPRPTAPSKKSGGWGCSVGGESLSFAQLVGPGIAAIALWARRRRRPRLPACDSRRSSPPS